TNDFIVSMDYLTGGKLGSVSVRSWDGTQFVLDESIGGEGCNLADTLCGFNNGGDIDGGPWPNYDRHGVEIQTLPRNAFTEFGADVTALVGATPCVSTFMGKTRSSQSFSAELKDFGAPVPFPVCGAAISIEPDGVNEVGRPHTFTVTLEQVVAGNHFPAPDGTPVTVTLTATNGASAVVLLDTCASPGTVGGNCRVTFTSNSAGTVTGHAAADMPLGGRFVHVETDGTGDNSDDAVKVYVDASISIGPALDRNSVEESHTFTVNVAQNLGDGAGFVTAPDGTSVAVTLSPTGGASVSDLVDTCASPGTSGGTCTVTFTSPTAGTVTGHASVTLDVLGVPLTRQTNGVGQNSGDAVKVFVAGALRWTKVDNANRLLGGATFTVCRTHDYNSGTGQMDPIAAVCADILDNTAPDQDPQAGRFLLTGLVLGRYTVHERFAPAGYAPDGRTETVDLTLAAPFDEIVPSFINVRPIVKITAFGYTNAPRGTPTDGVVTGHTVYTFSVKNFGLASATLAGSLSLSFSGSPGSFACSGTGVSGCTLDLAGIALNAGQELTFSLVLDYTNAPSGTSVTASLVVDYALNGLTRQASGSPASVTFTIQGG
ncbi:MAG TPA: hypothetical protein VJ397_08570, partial [Thermoplasmata archaeon]|nr:hypothetical protein [Thermoplasmata archaeon]